MGKYYTIASAAAKYTNVNATAIISAVNSAIAELNANNVTVTCTNHLESSAKSNILNAYRLVLSGANGSVNNLRKCLNNLKAAASLILECQKAEQSFNSIEPNLYYYQDDGGYRWNYSTGDWYRNSYGYAIWYSNWQLHTNYSVKSQLDSLNSQINNYDSQIKSLLS